jgi:hypothetical protein
MEERKSLLLEKAELLERHHTQRISVPALQRTFHIA